MYEYQYAAPIEAMQGKWPKLLNPARSGYNSTNMRKTIIAVGKIREQWIKNGIAEYSKRLGRYGKLEIIEVPDEKIPERYSQKEAEQAVIKEGERIMSRMPQSAAIVVLDREGEPVGSEGIAAMIRKNAVSGLSHMVFIIGGSVGVSPDILNSCTRRLSFGPNTFPHQLFRVMLLEQLYRAEKINAGETYHK